LMARFYASHLQGGRLPPARALHVAKQAMRRAAPAPGLDPAHPSAWAPVLCYGAGLR
ncbi:MAG: hypothetical protein IT458_00070, partial [Planctomycetes bacterium]|nr:hypothetical protein [Planctomycetota bacterium]